MVQRIDCLWTRGYKGHYIHGGFYDGVERIRWQNSDTQAVTYVKSLHAAKCQISRYLKRKQNESI